MPMKPKICPECRAVGGHYGNCPEMPEGDDERGQEWTREEIADMKNDQETDR